MQARLQREFELEVDMASKEFGGDKAPSADSFNVTFIRAT